MSPLAFSVASQTLDEEYLQLPLDQSQVHTIMPGKRQLDHDGGRLTDEDVVVVYVSRKQRRVQDKFVPRHIMTPYGRVGVDVREMPMPRILRLPVEEMTVFNANDYQRPLCPRAYGGGQIQPAGANWVGTGGGMIGVPTDAGGMLWGLLTNRHVTPEVGRAVGQPVASRRIGTTHAIAPWTLTNTASNQLDAAFVSCHIAGKVLCDPRMLKRGRMAAQAAVAAPNTAAAKEGRTTGLTQASCHSVGAVSLVGYDANQVGRFVNLDVYRDPPGSRFSAAGDSGSIIVRASDNAPMSLLFAGGGDITLAIPMTTVFNWLSAVIYTGDLP